MSAGAGRSLLIRVLGYGGSAVLISLAIGILVATFTGSGRGDLTGTSAREGGATAPGSGVVATLVPVEPGPTTPAPQGGTGSQGSGTDAGSGSGTTGGAPFPGGGGAPARPPCATRTAGYTRSGDDLTVRVRFTGTGYVSAFVEVAGRGTFTKSASGAGDHSFTFKDTPAELTKAVGLTTISKLGLSTCEVQPAGRQPRR